MVKTIRIDEERCDGCGLCVEACHEGALALIDGKAKLVRPNFCDGMGDCLPACPRDAISFLNESPAGRPDNGIAILDATGADPGPNMMAVPGVQWPIQLELVSSRSEFLKGHLVIAADCTAFMADSFKERFVGKDPLIIGCPKLDPRERFAKIAEILRNRPVDSVDVVRMEVPCCSQLTRIVQEAIQMSGRDIPMKEIVISRSRTVLARLPIYDTF